MRGWLAAFSLLLLGSDWKSAPFPDWSEETVLRVVTDSPWAKAKRVRINWTKRDPSQITYKDVPGADGAPRNPGGGPLGGIGPPKSTLPDTADVIVRWASALPVRHAKALFKLRDEKLAPERLNGLIAAPEADYVVEVFGLPSEVAHLGAASVESAARGSSILRAPGGKVIRPNRVEVDVRGTGLTLLIHFPRAAGLEVGDKEVEFSTDLQVATVKEKFRIGMMVYLGHLEL